MPELILGFLIGARHALDADHLSAVATLVARDRVGLKQGMRHGLFWGLGHNITLLAVALLVIITGQALSEGLAQALEWSVGIMLLLLGADLLRRLSRTESDSRGVGGRRLSGWRALSVGIMHGLAGSAALMLVMVSQGDSAWISLGYVLLFGLGTLVGMSVLSLLLALPLRLSARHQGIWFSRLQVLIALLSMGVGVLVLQRNSDWLIALL